MTAKDRSVPTLALALTVGLCGQLFAASEWDPAGSGRWADKSRWIGGTVPGAQAEIVINNCTGLVTAADATLFAQAKSIAIKGASGCLVISNDASEAKLVSAVVFSKADGSLLKLGSGTVNLVHTNAYDKETLNLAGGIDIRD